MTATVVYECERCGKQRDAPHYMRIHPGTGQQTCATCWAAHNNYGHRNWHTADMPPALYLAEENPEDQADRMDALARALIEARKLVEKWCHYQGPHPTLFEQYLSPIDEALTAAGYSLDDEIEKERMQ